MNKSAISDLVNRLKRQGPLKKLSSRVPVSVKGLIRRFIDLVGKENRLDALAAEASQTNDLLAAFIYEQARLSPRMKDDKRLLGAGFKVYSQHDEDGIIEEVFRRIGTTDRFFVEFGVGDGLENCTTYCLLKGWSGAWIDGSAACYEAIQRNMRSLIESGKLKARYSFITSENVEELFSDLNIPEEFDFLSIDIDYNDFWIWKALTKFRPRVVAIEYNSSFKSTVACTVPYDADRIWDYTNCYGASLKALEYLASEKDYCLVGCNYTGVTAFFVRSDLVGDRFAAPFTSENHFEPPRYFVRMPNGHAPGFGPIVIIERKGE